MWSIWSFLSWTLCLGHSYPTHPYFTWWGWPSLITMTPLLILSWSSAVQWGELGSNSKCVELRWPDRAYAPVSPACLPPQIQIDSNTNTTNCRDEISKSLETNQQKNIFNDQHFYKKKCTVNALNMANASNMHHGVATEKQLVLTSLLAVRESWRLPLTLAQPCQTKFHLLCYELVLLFGQIVRVIDYCFWSIETFDIYPEHNFLTT